MKRMAPQVELIVKKESFWVRVAMFGDMGFAEAWMLEEVECDGLTSFFELFIYNRDFLCNGSNYACYASLLTTPLTSLARNTNTLTNALLNVSAHYDISNAMFVAFLSSDMTYSCPIWRLSPRPGEPAEALEAAQMTKLHHIIGLLKLKMSDHVLEIGTGWGSFAIEAVRKTACKVTTLTLSTEQKLLAEERIEAAGLSSHITVLLCDYRSLATPEKPYDKLVSIEMLEAVGREYLTPYFACVDRFLKKQGGIAVFQCITMPEHRYAAYARSEDFIRKYIFPGGHLPSATLLLRSIEKGSKGSLIPEKLENIGGHYARALRLWREAFTKNFESKIAPALREQHDDIDEDEIEVFKRKWIVSTVLGAFHWVSS
jgi:cyclopropane-fatty-acyl-phospholipid synthase